MNETKQTTPEWMEAFMDMHKGGYRPAGICLSCRHGSGCHGRRYKNACDAYVSRQLTKEEWKQHYAGLLQKMMQPQIGIDQYRAFGNAGTCRRAMLQIHGFKEPDLRKIEDGIEELKTETGIRRIRKLRWEV